MVLLDNCSEAYACFLFGCIMVDLEELKGVASDGIEGEGVRC